MTRPTRRSRRNALRLIAGSGAAVLAGCGAPESGDDGDGAGPEEGEEPGDDEEPGADEERETPTEEDGESEDETEQQETDGGGEGGEEGGNEDEEGASEGGEDGADGDDGTGDGAATGEWTEGDEIVLDGFTAGWEGVEPAAIEGETNPALVLTEGVEYDLVWENADGQPHNIEIHDGDGEIVDDYSTEIVEEEGETQTLTIEATAEMAEYVCIVHPTTMVGPIEIDDDG
ncbi:cupredoxin domain-containing protein [Saliphagus infecundisoli]|uniref:Plastocyanin/azurin family copper-binding protein n=1 Tax=Saliphagus infecundisoli TaxID=1849069 RepID=A0ABD5QEU4_9EURY|nr:plastocyanin/azurin family copper-binding protein [Saliphagus infecundisoli]